MAIRPADHRPLLDAILADYNLAPDALELVADVQAWSDRHCIEEPNPFCQAKCARGPDGAFHIAIVDLLTDQMINGGKGDMMGYGMMSKVETLDTDLKYLVHLLLHEIAGDVLRTGEQRTRDEWAFERVSKYA
jgi:hypothetical protein